MRRREFITLLGGAAATWPLAARAQQAGKLPTIGFLGALTPSVESQRAAAFVLRLRELGWIEGRTIAIEYRWAEGSGDRSTEIAAEFVRLKVDVIVTAGTPAVIAAKQATSAIPIVFAVAGDPLRTGLIATLARPGANVTGLSSQLVDLSAKRIGLLREVIPYIGRLAIMGNVNNPAAALDMRQAEATAGTLGVDVAVLEIRRAEDIGRAFETFNGRADALYVPTDPLVLTNQIQIDTLALRARLPTIYGGRENVEAGGLMSYGANIPDQFKRSADFVDKILRGTRPGDIPVEQPTKFELAINLKTAKALNLEVPTSILLRADEVIE